MKKLAQEFGTESDTQELRDRMHEGRTKTAALGKETANLLKAQAADKARQDKLKRQLQSQMAEFEKMSQDHRRQEREMLVQMEEQYSSTYNRAPDLGGSYQEDENEEGVGRGRTRTKLALELADGMEDADAKIIQERNREVQMLDNELGEVVDLFNEVNDMVEEQGTKLDEADTRLEMSEVSELCVVVSIFF
jgi:t-SNARE complex subunit (syntaxin)